MNRAQLEAIIHDALVDMANDVSRELGQLGEGDVDKEYLFDIVEGVLQHHVAKIFTRNMTMH